MSIETQTKVLQAPRHAIELQAIRGLAALAVLFHHCTFYYRYPLDYRRVAEVLINAHACVVLFFVLSGFVLTGSLLRTAMTWQTVTVFYFKRCFRIYPALFFATALTILYIFMFHGHPMPTWSSMWWGDTRNEPIVARNIARAALGLGKLDPMPVWTLFIELVGSAILPPMVFILIRSRLLFLFVTLLLLLLSFVYGQQVRLHFGVYLIDFAIGAGLTSILPITERLLKARSVLFVRFLALAFFLAFWLGRQIGGWSYVPYYDAPLPALLEAVGGAMLLAIVCARHDLFSFLRARPLERLGDISYSLYLIHPTVMFFIATIGGEVLAMDVFYRDPLIATLALIASTITVSVGVAALSYRYIELSGIRFGQLLQARASDGVRAK